MSWANGIATWNEFDDVASLYPQARPGTRGEAQDLLTTTKLLKEHPKLGPLINKGVDLEVSGHEVALYAMPLCRHLVDQALKQMRLDQKVVVRETN